MNQIFALILIVASCIAAVCRHIDYAIWLAIIANIVLSLVNQHDEPI